MSPQRARPDDNELMLGLKSRDADIRRRSLDAACTHGAAGFQLLIESLTYDIPWDFRQLILIRLGESGFIEAAPMIRSNLQSGLQSNDSRLIMPALTALARIEGPSATADAAALLDHRIAQVRQRACEVLGCVGTGAALVPAVAAWSHAIGQVRKRRKTVLDELPFLALYLARTAAEMPDDSLVEVASSARRARAALEEYAPYVLSAKARDGFPKGGHWGISEYWPQLFDGGASNRGTLVPSTDLVSVWRKDCDLIWRYWPVDPLKPA